MKVTALIPDKIVDDVKILANGKNLTESLIIALREWISLKKIHTLNKSVEKSPLQFKNNFSANKIRKINRNR